MIMPFEGTHTAAEQPCHSDVSPYLHAVDEQAYCDAILPLLGDVESPAFTMPTEDDLEWEGPHQEPIPGHFHYADAGYWA